MEVAGDELLRAVLVCTKACYVIVERRTLGRKYQPAIDRRALEDILDEEGLYDDGIY